MYSFQVAGRGPGQLEACGSKVHGYWMKATLQIALLVLIPRIALGQFTQVQGTVVDPNGVPYSNGTIMATLVISGSPRFASSGLPYTPPTTPTGLDAQGRFVMQLADVTQLLPPGGVWTFTVNCTGGCIPPGIGVGPVTFTTTGITISGSVQDISSFLQAAAPPLTGGAGGGVHINGSPTASPNFNSTTPPPPPNSAPIIFQTSGSNVSAALEGSGDPNDCFHGDGIFKPCGVGTGAPGQYALYNGTNSIAGDPHLTNNGTTISSTLPISLSSSGFLTAAIPATTATLPPAGQTAIAFVPSTASPVLSVSIGGNAYRSLYSTWINNSAVPLNTVGGNSFLSLNGGPTGICNPVAPANGKCISFQLSGAQASAYLLGDGSTNCLSGQGTYVPCGSGGAGSGTVGNGTANQFAFYSTTGTSIVGTPTLTYNGTFLTASPPIAANSGVELLTLPLYGAGATFPVSGSGAFGFLAGGIPAISTNGGPFVALGNTNAISALTSATATNTISNGDFGQVWQWSLATANNTGLNITESAPSTAAGSSLVKISQPTSGTLAVPLTIQSGASSAAINAFQIQNPTLANTLTISSGGTISTSGVYQTIPTAGVAQLCGGAGNCSISNSGPAGGARVRGSDNTASSANASGGFGIVAAGAITSTTPLATQVNNVTQLASPFYCTGTCTLTTVMCSTGALDQVTACATTPQSEVIGISEGTGAGTSVWVTSAGTAQVRVDNTAVVGHTLCTSTTTAGSATDNGGTGPCTTGQQIGVVMAVTGTTQIPSGSSSATTVTFSTSAPKVALADLGSRAGSSGLPGSGLNPFVATSTLQLPNGTATAPALTGGTGPNVGIFFSPNNNNEMLFPASGAGTVPYGIRGNSGFTIASAWTLNWVPTVGDVSTVSTPDISLNRCSAGILCVGTSNVSDDPSGRLETAGNLFVNQTLPAPVAGESQLATDATGALFFSQAGGPFAALGTGGGGSGTVGAGTAGQFAFYSASGNTVVGTSSLSNNGALILSNLPFATVAGTIPGSGISQIGNAPTGGQIGFLQGNVGTSTFIPFFGFDVNGSAVVTTAPAPFVNLNATTPAAPANGRNITWSVSNNNVSGALVGDGSLNCLSGQGTYVACAGATGGGVSGSGSVGFFPIFTNTTALGNGPMSAVFSPPGTVNNITVAQANGLPIAPSVATAGFISGMEMQVTSAAANCGGTVSIAPNGGTTPGCTGQHINFGQNDATSTGVNTALFAQNIGSGVGAPNGVLNMGVMGSVTTQVPTAEERAGYFEANDANVGTVVTTTRRGVMGVAINATTRTTALNEGVVAQTGAPSSVNTQDFSMHCLAPSSGNSTSMPIHACMKIEPQGTGVELQTGAHVFASLPQCSPAYEGSIAAITDGSASSGTVTGGGTNHVQIYCNGTNWTVSGGGGGGTTTGPLICTSTTGVGFSNSGGNATLCTFTLAPSHNYLVRCVYSLSFGTQSTSAVSDVDVGIHVVNGPANLSFFRGTFTDPSKTFADQSSVSGVQGTAGNGGVANSFNLMRAMNIGSSPPNTTTNQEGFAFTIDGTYNTSAAGDTLIFYVGASLAGSTGFVEPGYYCRLE